MGFDVAAKGPYYVGKVIWPTCGHLITHISYMLQKLHLFYEIPIFPSFNYIFPPVKNTPVDHVYPAFLIRDL